MPLKLLSQLTTILQEYETVVALAINGSVAREEADEWSDLDLIIVVTAMVPLFPSLDWLNPMGEIFTYSQSSSEDRGTTRIVFDDLRRVDLSFHTQQAVQSLTPDNRVSFCRGSKIIFSRSKAISEKLTAAYSPPVNTFSRHDFSKMANDFWFKAVLAVTKIARDDRLIAAHLVLDCWRDVMVLAMRERDLSTGTTVHKTGGVGNDFVNQLLPFDDFGSASLLSQLKDAAILFEVIALRLYPDYVSIRHKLLTLIQRAS
jgi:hypothetical protein